MGDDRAVVGDTHTQRYTGSCTRLRSGEQQQGARQTNERTNDRPTDEAHTHSAPHSNGSARDRLARASRTPNRACALCFSLQLKLTSALRGTITTNPLGHSKPPLYLHLLSRGTALTRSSLPRCCRRRRCCLPAQRRPRHRSHGAGLAPGRLVLSIFRSCGAKTTSCCDVDCHHRCCDVGGGDGGCCDDDDGGRSHGCWCYHGCWYYCGGDGGVRARLGSSPRSREEVA